MDRWGDELVERLRNENEGRFGFSAIQSSAATKPTELFTDGPYDLGINRFAIGYQLKPNNSDGTSIPSGFITPQGIRAPNTREAKQLLRLITKASEDVGKALEEDNRLWTHHITTVWLSQNYTTKREGASSQVVQVLNEVADDLNARINKLIEDLIAGEGLVRRTAAVIASQLTGPAYNGNIKLIEDMRGALVTAAQDRDLAVRYEATIALARVARTFFKAEAMISTAIMTLFETVDDVMRRGNETFVLGPMAELIRTYDKLTAHPDDYWRFVDCLNPYSIEVLKGITMLKKLKSGGASSAVRTSAKDTLTVLGQRMANFSWDGTPGSCPANGSAAPQTPPSTPPVDGWWGAASFHSMAQYVGINAAVPMRLPQIPRFS